MQTPGYEQLSFPDMLGLIADRSDTLRRAASAAGLSARVPGCPDWSVADLVTHLGEVQLFWAADVDAGESAAPPSAEQLGDRTPQGDLLEWSSSATDTLIGALREAGPDRMVWTWWEASGAPMTSSAVARHQVQEAAVHCYDAQQSAGQAEPLPPAAAADGVGEFLTVGLRTMGPWPFEPATAVLETGAGGDWLLDLGHLGVTVLHGAEHGDAKREVTVSGDPGDVILALYRRDLIGELTVDGDTELWEQLQDWADQD
jgi:uncharacterized protein (TIGR03083 family)